MLNRAIDQFVSRPRSERATNAMLGDSLGTYMAHAADPTIRARAASGGAASAILIAALDRGLIDGAIVCRTFIEDGKVRAHFVIARTVDDILAARGSKYVETRFLREVLPLLEQNDGRFAVCGLPCDITNLRRWETKNPQIAERVALRLAFVCGHNSRKELIDGVVGKLKREAGGSELTDFHFSYGHWRGKLEARFANGQVIRKGKPYYSDYRNCGFFVERKCLACIDHFGYDADISLGDVWLFALRDRPIKETGILVRTGAGDAAFQTAFADGHINRHAVSRATILQGQSRVAPIHYNVSARSRAGRWLGVKIPDRHNMPVGPVKLLSAWLSLLNMKISEGRLAPLLFRLPRPVVRLYAAFKKGIEAI